MKTRDDIYRFLLTKLLEDDRVYSRNQDVKRFENLAERWTNDEHPQESMRLDLIQDIMKSKPPETKILDVAAGCGSFVFKALRKGFDVHGIEPESWKLKIIASKIDVYGYDTKWKNRIVAEYAEALPYSDEMFDVIDSWQTLEHVKDPSKSIEEFFRVLKPGGFAIIHAPNYMSFFEGHYRILWFPLMHGKIAEMYLKLRGRPIAGLATFSPISKRSLQYSAKQAKFEVFNLKLLLYRVHFQRSYSKLWSPFADMVFWLKKLSLNARTLFSAERSTHLLLIKPPLDLSPIASFTRSYTIRD